MNHEDLISRAERWLANTRLCGIVLAERCGNCHEIPDVVGIKNGGRYTIVVECKISRSDFFADHNKGHRRFESPASERWYFTPPGLVQLSDVPEGWALAEVLPKRVRVMVKKPEAKMVPRDKIDRRMADKWAFSGGFAISELNLLQQVARGRAPGRDSRAVRRLRACCRLFLEATEGEK